MRQRPREGISAYRRAALPPAAALSSRDPQKHAQVDAGARPRVSPAGCS